MENIKDKPKDVSSFLHLLSLSEGAQWLHLCIRHEGTASYLTEQIKLDDLVVQALQRAQGNQTQAAQLLGMNRDQIRYRL